MAAELPEIAIMDAEKCLMTLANPDYRCLPTGNVSGKILHVVPTDAMLMNARVYFASSYTREACVYKFLKNKTFNIQAMLGGLEMGTLKGLVFECFAHRILLEGGDFQVSLEYNL